MIFLYSGSASTLIKYFYAGTQRVAMKKGSTVYYLFGDHLGSTAITASSAGAKLGELRYKPWGENRYTWGTTYTNRHFTGQLDETTAIGLYFFNARFYDPLLARFTSADSIVPEPGNPQAWDRYAYTLNNPVKYIDPTGHRSCSEKQAASGDETCNQNYNADDLIHSLHYQFGWTIEDKEEWTVDKLLLLHETARDFKNYIQEVTNRDGREWMRANLGNASFYNIAGKLTTSHVIGNQVNLDFIDLKGEKQLIAHELSHLLDFNTGKSLLGGGVSSALIEALGGKPGFIPLIDNGPFTLSQEYQFSPKIKYGRYGNRSTIEYFAVGLSYAIYDPGVLNPVVKSSFDAVILMLATR